MPHFKYKAMRTDGAVIEGEGVFTSPEDLFFSLQREGLVLVDYKVQKIPSLRFTRIKRKDMAEFLHQLSIMVKSGLPLVSSLEDLEKEIKTAGLRNVVKNLRRSLLGGESFSQAVEKTKAFPPIILTLIQIGENTGTLDKSLEEGARYLYRTEEIRQNIKRALIYPFFILFAMLGALAFWFFVVLPKVLQVFKEMGIKLPLPTLMLIEVVNFLLKIKYIIPVVIIGSIVLFIFLHNYKKTQRYSDWVLLRVPIFGRIKRLNFLSFFFEHFALLIRSGIDILRLLKLMKESMHRVYFQRIVESIESDILRGETISNSLRKIDIFRPLDIRMVTVGESTGRLPEQMQMLADFYMQEVKNLVDNLTKILEPAILFVAGIIFFIIVIALIGPIYELIGSVGKIGG